MCSQFVSLSLFSFRNNFTPISVYLQTGELKDGDIAKSIHFSVAHFYPTACCVVGLSAETVHFVNIVFLVFFFASTAFELRP